MSTIASLKGMPPPEPGHRIWRAWHCWWNRQWTALRPGAEARRGGMRGILAVLTMFVAVRLLFLPSGFGLAFDAAFVIAATVFVPVVTAMILVLILLGLRSLPLVGTGVFVGACVLVTSGWFLQPSTSLTPPAAR